MEMSQHQTSKHLLQYGILFLGTGAESTSKKIVVCECFVAGIAHHGGEMRREQLFSGQPLVLCREADNVFDTRAVALYTTLYTRDDTTKQKLGYLPRTSNAQPALLLDQHFPLGASIVHIDGNAALHRAVSIAVYKIIPQV